MQLIVDFVFPHALCAHNALTWLNTIRPSIRRNPRKAQRWRMQATCKTKFIYIDLQLGLRSNPNGDCVVTVFNYTSISLEMNGKSCGERGREEDWAREKERDGYILLFTEVRGFCIVVLKNYRFEVEEINRNEIKNRFFRSPSMRPIYKMMLYFMIPNGIRANLI